MRGVVRYNPVGACAASGAISALALALWLFGILSCALPAHAASLEDGSYEVQVSVLQAAKDERSMCDKAVVNLAKLAVSGAESKLSVSFQPLKVGAVEGYLGRVTYFPGYDGSGLPDEDDAVEAHVLSTYASATDAYNGSESADSLMRGLKYPKEVELSWNGNPGECYLRVYVPVMNAISPGSGWQFVRLAVDYGSAKRMSESPASGDGADDSGEGGEAAGGDSEIADGPGQSENAETGEGSSASGSSASAEKGRSDSPSDSKGSSGSKSSSSSGASKSSAAAKGSSSSASSKDGEAGSSRQPDSSGDERKAGFAHLADGSYTISGSMVKVDRKTTSMADAAIDHAIGLTVKDGAYRLAVKLNQVTVGGRASYLGKLSYFKTGYGRGESGEPTGKVGSCKVVSYQMKGARRVSDDLGADYPAEVQIPLIPEAKKDGFVPLRAFVPAMEAIAAGTGTQSMYLKLDVSSVAEAGAKRTDASQAKSESAGQRGSASSGGSSSASPAKPKAGGSRVLSGSTLPTANPSAPASATSPGVSPSGSGVSPDVLAKAEDAPSQQVGAVGSGKVPSDSASVSITELNPVEPTPTETASSQDERQPPLKNALVPAAFVGCGVVALGAGSALLRHRERLLD